MTATTTATTAATTADPVDHDARTTGPATPKGPTAMKAVTDTAIVLTRELRPTVRNPFSVIFSMVQPLVFLGLFGPLVTSMPGLGEAASLQWFVPGIVVMSVLFASSTTGANLLLEMQSGSHERMLVTPLNRSSLLFGRALKEIVPTIVQTALIIAVVLPFGFSLAPAGTLIGLALLVVFGTGLGALSYTLALAVKNEDWVFWAVQQTLLFPLLLLAGMLLPMDVGPAWLQTASRVNPLTHVVEAERALFAGNILDGSVARGAVAAVAVAAIGLTVGIRAIRRSAH